MRVRDLSLFQFDACVRDSVMNGGILILIMANYEMYVWQVLMDHQELLQINTVVKIELLQIIKKEKWLSSYVSIFLEELMIQLL